MSAPDLSRLAEPLVERVAGAAHSTDGIGCPPAVERAAPAADGPVDSTPVDIAVAAPPAVEQLLAGIDPAGILHQELEQTKFGRPEMHLAPRTRDALLLAIELQVAGAEHHRHPLRARAAQQ